MVKKTIPKITILVSFFIIQHAFAQNYQSVEEVNNACSQLGFAGDEDAEIAVDRILDQLGLFRNFTIQECPNINNAVAKNIEISPGHKERYILYDATFFNNMDERANSDWAAISILAHEIGHHLNGHALNNEGSNHQWELEADYFSGISLAKMGATLEEAQSAINTLRYEKATRTHPAKVDRLNEIEKGWNKGKGKTNTQNTEEENKEKADEFYRKGELAFQDYKFTEAKTYFEHAKKLGNVDAYYYLSNMYYLGFGVMIDNKEAYVLAKKGYEMGSIPATYQLGKYLSNGTGVAKNKDDAARLFQKNFQVKWFKEQFNENNIPFHAYTLGYMYNEGYGGVTKDDKTAINWYNQAASQGDLVAQNNLGVSFNTGRGVVQDMNIAVAWFQKAADHDFSRAQFNLALRYYHGEGVGQDYTKAVKWFRKAAENGYDAAQFSLGLIYDNGNGVQQDYSIAVNWYRKAAENDYISAQNNLANKYFRGQGVNQSYEDARYWYLKAADKGAVKAQFNLGRLYYVGNGVTKNYSEALTWFRKAANQGDARAENLIGNIYYYGNDVAINYNEAFKWYLKAANKNHAAGQYNIGYMYYKGLGVKKDKKEGLVWYQKAARQGYAAAQKELKELRKTW